MEPTEPCGRGDGGTPIYPAPKGNRYAEKHGFNTLKRAVVKLGGRAIDGRYQGGRQLQKWRRELVDDLGGVDSISTQQEALIDLAVKSKLILDSIDAWILTQDTLIHKRKKAIFPVIVQRQTLADGLAKYLNMLGLERRHKVTTLHDLLTHDEPENPEQPSNGNGKAD